MSTDNTHGVKAISEQMINEASRNDDLNAALFDLQKVAGIDSGDVAGRYFAGEREEQWVASTRETRLEWLHGYLELEAVYED